MWSTTPSFAVTLLFVGVGLCTWLALGRPALEEVDTREMYVSRPFSADKKCWVLNHLNKAGGSTLKYMLKPWIQEHNVSAGLYDSPQWSSGKNVAQEYLSLDNTLTWGAYTEGLRPYGADNCKWFTIFRQWVDFVLCSPNTCCVLICWKTKSRCAILAPPPLKTFSVTFSYLPFKVSLHSIMSVYKTLCFWLLLLLAFSWQALYV